MFMRFLPWTILASIARKERQRNPSHGRAILASFDGLAQAIAKSGRASYRGSREFMLAEIAKWAKVIKARRACQYYERLNHGTERSSVRA